MFGDAESAEAGYDALTELYADEPERRKAEAEKAAPMSEDAMKQHADKQGNPVNSEGKLIVETIQSIDEITDDGFNNPVRSVQLSEISLQLGSILPINGRGVIVKKNFFDKNRREHHELTPQQSRGVLQKALYSTDMIVHDKPNGKPNYWILVKVGEHNALVNIDTDPKKDNVEVVGWRLVRGESLEQIKNRANRDGGQIIMTQEGAAGLSALTTESVSAGKDSENSGENQDGKGGVKRVNADKHGINIYTDVLEAAEAEGHPIKNRRQFQEKFFEVCRHKGWIPRFEEFIDRNRKGEYVYTPGYEKLLIDFKLFDKKGRILPQEAGKPVFDGEFLQKILADYVEGEKAQMDYDGLYEAVKADLGLDEGVSEQVRVSIGEGEDYVGMARRVADEQEKRLYDRSIPKNKAEAKNLIRQVVDFSKRVKNKVGRVIVGGVTKRQAEDYKAIGLPIDDSWVHSVENSAIGHNQKRHGGLSAERNKNQIAVSETDYELIPEILESYDNLSLSPEKDKQGLDVVIYEKEYPGGNFIYLEEVRTNRKSLAFKTMYKKKKGIDSPGGLMQNASPLTSETTPGNFDSEGKGIDFSQEKQELSPESAKAVEGVEGGEQVRFSLVTDPELHDRLEKELNGEEGKDWVYAYRGAVKIGDEYYSPMASREKAENGRKVMREPIRMGEIEQTDEAPEKASVAIRYKGHSGKEQTRYVQVDKRDVEAGDETLKHTLGGISLDESKGERIVMDKGNPALYFKLMKDNGEDLSARYNSYLHMCLSTPLNDQFASAWNRPNLVVLKVKVPMSELKGENPYKGLFCKDSVGKVAWREGAVSSALSKAGKPREVALSRYDMPIEEVPVDKVADMIADQLKGTGIEIPINTVTPQLQTALRERGVRFCQAEKKGAGANAMLQPGDTGYEEQMRFSILGEKGAGSLDASDREAGRHEAAKRMAKLDEARQMENPKTLEDIKAGILRLFKGAVAGKIKGKSVEIGKISDKGRKFIAKVSGLRMKPEISFMLNPSDLVHINNDHFGDNEKDLGQNIPLTEEDICNMAEIIHNPDHVAFVEDKDGRNMFIFLKADPVSGCLNLAEVYADRRGNLTAKSLYKTKKDVSHRVMALESQLSTSAANGAILSSANIENLFDMTKGFSAKAIKYATGWERGADGKWRYEVPDGKLKDDAFGTKAYAQWKTKVDRLYGTENTPGLVSRDCYGKYVSTTNEIYKTLTVDELWAITLMSMTSYVRHCMRSLRRQPEKKAGETLTRILCRDNTI